MALVSHVPILIVSQATANDYVSTWDKHGVTVVFLFALGLQELFMMVNNPPCFHLVFGKSLSPFIRLIFIKCLSICGICFGLAFWFLLWDTLESDSSQ